MKAGFPIASLALLTTALACLLVCTDVDRWREQYQWFAADLPWRAIWVFGGAALFGASIGVVYLFVSRASWRARLLALPAGVLAGEIGMLILIAPGPIWRTIFAIGVLLCASVLFRIGAE